MHHSSKISHYNLLKSKLYDPKYENQKKDNKNNPN
jgi:hypothetical protein